MEGRNSPLLLLALAGGATAALAAGLVIRPFGPATIDPDAAASVLYLERIVGGHRLEAFVPTTPKPLLTVAYGLVHALSGDWRALTWLTLLLFAAAVALALAWTWQTVRPAAPAVAAAAGAAFVGTALASSPDLVLEVSRANSLVWALAGWLVAGLAMTAGRRRPAVAGLALLLAGLARVETLLIVGGGAVALATLLASGWRARSRGLPTRAGPRWAGGDPLVRDLLLVVVMGAGAVPLACLHDLVLTGDPWFWTSVPARYTELYAPSISPIGPFDYLRTLGARFVPEWPLLVLATLGGTWLVLRRRWVAVVGLGSLGFGMVALLALLAARGTYISARYYEPLDLVVLFLAAAGPAGAATALGAARDRARGRRRPMPGPSGIAPATGAGRNRAVPALVGATLVGVVLGIAVEWPAAPFDRSVAASLDLVRASSVALERYAGRLGSLAGPAVLSSGVAAGAPLADAAGVRLFVPSLLRPRIAVDTGRPLTALGDTYATSLASPPWAGLHAGQRLYHDRAADRPDALDRSLEVDPARLGQAVARPEVVDEAAGVRILVVESP